MDAQQSLTLPALILQRKNSNPLATKFPQAKLYSKATEKEFQQIQKTQQGKFNNIIEKFQLPENDSDSTENLENLTYNLTEKKILKLFPEKSDSVKMEGILLGGCLDVLSNLCGTKLDSVKEFNRSAEKIIWVLESCDGNPA